MSLYKILEEVKVIRRFQLVQTDIDRIELRLESDQKENAFTQARKELHSFFQSREINPHIILSDQMPQADPGGRFRHIYNDQKQ